MFDWISDLISGIGNAISSALSGVWETVSGSIWGVFMNWLYTSVYNALADFFTMMTELVMGTGCPEILLFIRLGTLYCGAGGCHLRYRH